MKNGWIIAGIVVGVTSLILYFYNRLVSSRQNVREAWSGIDVQLRRRHDLIPNLVEVVKGYAKHEEQLFKQIAETRAKALSFSSSNVDSLAKVEEQLGKSVKSLFAVAEAYPELKANENFLKLQTGLSETEDQIASARRIYNSNVADYNTHIGVFPANIVARLFHFSEARFFQVSPEEK
jgi:LemA protein